MILFLSTIWEGHAISIGSQPAARMAAREEQLEELQSLRDILEDEFTAGDDGTYHSDGRKQRTWKRPKAPKREIKMETYGTTERTAYRCLCAGAFDTPLLLRLFSSSSPFV